ncbi:MAG: hypothetical protein JWP44_4195 [Mucilaginibacter sp.]|nr:hypothetical protein [Mucilaginibacter sp.]
MYKKVKYFYTFESMIYSNILQHYKVHMQAKIKEKQMAIDLRLTGETLNSISKKLNIGKGTASEWLRDYKLSKERIHELNLSRRKKSESTRKVNRLARYEQYKNVGKELIQCNNKFRELCLLYWAEGTKNERRKFAFSNSDAHMLIFILNILQELDCKNKIYFTVYCHRENDITDDEVRKYWIKILKIDALTIYRPETSRASQRKSKNKLMYGTGVIGINSIEFLNIVLGGIAYLKEEIGTT